MLSLLLAGDGTVVAAAESRAQLPLLLAQAPGTTTPSALGIAVETDTAFPIAVIADIIATSAQLPLLLAQAEASSVDGFVVQVGLVGESDLAQAITVVTAGELFVPVGLAEQVSTALAITVATSGAVFIAVEIAEETDEAFSILFRRSFISPVGLQTTSLTAGDDAEGNFLTPVVVS